MLQSRPVGLAGFAKRVTSRPRAALPVIALLWLASSFVHAPSEPLPGPGPPSLQLGPLALAPPRVLSGDPPHYLVVLHSVTSDYDLELSDEYRSARQGGAQAGLRFRGRPLDPHTDLDSRGRQWGTHSPFLPALLAPLAWPLRGTVWVEPLAVLATLAAALAAVALLPGLLPASAGRGDAARAMLLLALATPLWCYARDLWTGPWVLALWVALLRADDPRLAALLGLVGTLIRFPFAVVPATLGVLALRRGERRRGVFLLSASVGGLALAVGLIQYLFRDVDHFSVFHSGIHAGFDGPLDGMAGLLLHPVDGLLPFFPVLAWGLWEFRKGGDLYLPALVYFLVHACYQDWGAGTGFSARYLVPVLPFLVLGICRLRPRGVLFKLALAWSLLWGFVGGVAPALTYDRSPWGVVLHVGRHLAGGP